MNTQVFSVNLRRILHSHDEYPAFHAGYLVLTFLIAALFNLGMFALLISAHMMLDYIKYTELHQYGHRKALRAMISRARSISYCLSSDSCSPSTFITARGSSQPADFSVREE